MMKSNEPVNEWDLTSLYVLAVPVAILIGLMSEIRGPTLSMWVLTSYLAFLGFYLVWVAGVEYRAFGQLHCFKSRPADAFLLAIVFFSILQVSHTADSVTGSLGWLAIFLFTLVLWETYTMVCSFDQYFGRPRRANQFTILEPRRPSLDNDVMRDRDRHWREYQYWVLIDGSLFLVVLAGWTVSDHMLQLMSQEVIKLTIGVFGLGIGVFNVWRYSVLIRTIRRFHIHGNTE